MNRLGFEGPTSRAIIPVTGFFSGNQVNGKGEESGFVRAKTGPIGPPVPRNSLGIGRSAFITDIFEAHS